MASLHDFASAHAAKHPPRDAALALLQRIIYGADAALQHMRSTPPDPMARNNVNALGALMAHAAGQVALLCDGRERLDAQYLVRLSEILREQTANADPLRIEAVASAILSAATALVDRIERAP
jgi:hypothetical protein